MEKQKRYSSEFKQSTVQHYLQGNLSASHLARELGVHPHTVRHWIHEYHNDEAEGINIVGERNTDCLATESEIKAKDSKKSEIRALFFRINELEQEVSELKTILLTYLVN